MTKKEQKRYISTACLKNTSRWIYTKFDLEGPLGDINNSDYSNCSEVAML